MKKTIILLSSILTILTCTAANMPVYAASHTFESSHTDEWYDNLLDNEKDKWYTDKDGIIYLAGNSAYNAFDPYIPNPGTFDRSELLLALLHKYPDNRFAVQLDSWCDDDSQETGEKEKEYLKQNGIEYTIVTEGVHKIKYAVLNAAQLENFPVYEKAGYLISLAGQTGVSYEAANNDSINDNISDILKGDVNRNGKIDLYDAIYVSEFIIRARNFTEEEIKIADMNNDNTVNLYDVIEIAKALM